MSIDSEYRCFVGGLAWSTTDRDLEDAFRSFGNLLEAKVVVDRDSGRSKGFGFVTFGDERAMEDAIERMHGMSLGGRNITVDKAQTKSGGGGGDRGYGGGGSGGGRGYSGGGGGSQDCFKCGRPGHWARECPNSGGGGGRSGDKYSGSRDRDGRGDRYGNGSSGGRYANDRDGDRYGGRPNASRESGGRGSGERYSGGRGSGGGPTRNDGGSYRDRSGPYDRPSGGGSGPRSYEDRH